MAFPRLKLLEFVFCVFLIFFKFYFIIKLYKIVLVLPNIQMNPPQVFKDLSGSGQNDVRKNSSEALLVTRE